ncbi:MAG: galactokinase [bacterium]|nr:galactokinase [bacterium]
MNAESAARSRALDAFRRRFVRSADFAVRAPGRVNLIGEHTDYCDGWVLPCAIDRELWLAVGARDDDRVRIFAADLSSAGEEVAFEVDELKSFAGFGGYIKGVLAAFREQDVRVPGMDLAIASDVPVGSGLSSSAALSVATACAIDRLLEGQRGAAEIACLAHRGESHYVGTGCGILDPFAIALAQPNHALRIDCRTRDVTPIPLPAERIALVLSHSGVTRRLAARGGEADPGAGYRERVAQCAQALALAKQVDPELRAARALRDVPLAALVSLESRMDDLLYRRLRHVVSEIARVDRVCEALRAPGGADLVAVGTALREAHVSLRDDHQVSTPELDLLCEAADGVAGTYGSRLMGAGFGGCALHLVRPDAVDDVREEVSARFAERFDRVPSMLTVSTGTGASVVPVAAH